MKGLFLNCTLKPSPAVSNTQALADRALATIEGLGCQTETVRVVDHDVRFGVTNDEGAGDEWPRRPSGRFSFR